MEDVIAFFNEFSLSSKEDCVYSQIKSSATGNAYLVRVADEPFIAKLYAKQERHVAERALWALNKLKNITHIQTPIPYSKNLFTSSSGKVGYLYKHIEGSPLWDFRLTSIDWDVVAHMILDLTTALKSLEYSDDFERYRPIEYEFNTTEINESKALSLFPNIENIVYKVSHLNEMNIEQSKFLIHSDLHTGNMILNSNSVVPIDFDSMRIAGLECALAPFFGKLLENPDINNSYFLKVASLFNLIFSSAELPLSGIRLWQRIVEKKINEILYIEKQLMFSKGVTDALNLYLQKSTTGLNRAIEVWQQLKYLSD